ncbi:hypothetical protein SASPL_151357 [Salvia splendens]|uniref:Uncharacterized protein n=1 Tax=Salvia splendens TaxID=180675 RepID=A0A8X8Z3M7_SALSN|nr:hypothetical protein SASPL_151357 [Salvia splendens]
MLCHNPKSCTFHVEARLSTKMWKCHHSLSFWNWFQMQCKLLIHSYLQKLNRKYGSIVEQHKFGSSEGFTLWCVIVNLPVSLMNCSEGRQTRESIPISLKGSPFTVSALDNTFLVLGCNTAVWFHDNGTLVGGCLAMCDDANASGVTSCNGINCCQTPIPRRGQGFEFTYQFIQPSNSSFCGYVFPVDTNWWDIEGYKKPKGLVDNLLNPFDGEFRFVPLVLEWEFGNQDGHCSSPDSNYGCPRSSYEYETYLG